LSHGNQRHPGFESRESAPSWIATVPFLLDPIHTARNKAGFQKVTLFKLRLALKRAKNS
jgi:hypothetical protein